MSVELYDELQALVSREGTPIKTGHEGRCFEVYLGHS
jgi:hypothetical protein